MAACTINQIFIGEVASVQNYGAFVRIPGCNQQGLVHRTQVSSAHVDDVAEVLQRGERVWCKVISIGEDGKIALSMKLVNQGNGKDLDPNGVQLQLDEQKRKKMNNREERKVIVLDAVYKTICAKCKTPGHLSKDCFSTPDGKKYELLPEIEDEKPIFKQVETETKQKEKPKEKSKEKKNKSRKSKKRKKQKSSKQENSDSEDNESSDEKNKKRKKKSKEQKHKKKRRHNSSSDSDSDSADSVSSYENKKHSKKCKHSRVKYSD